MKKRMIWVLGLLVLVVAVFGVTSYVSKVPTQNQDMGAVAILPTDSGSTETTTLNLVGQGGLCTAHNQCGSGYCQTTLEYSRSGIWPFYSYKQLNRCNNTLNTCIVNPSKNVQINERIRVSTIGSGYPLKAISYNPTGYYYVSCGFSPATNYGYYPLNSQVPPPQGYPWYDFNGLRKY